MKAIVSMVVIFACINISYAQVGLLSTNNKSAKEIRSKDTVSYRLNSNLDGNVESDLHITIPGTTFFTYYPSEDLLTERRVIDSIIAIRDNFIKARDQDKRLGDDEKRALNDTISSLTTQLVQKNIAFERLSKLYKEQDSIANILLSANFDLMFKTFKTSLDGFSVLFQKSKNKAYTNYLLARDYKSYLDSSKKIKDKNVYQAGIADVQMRFIDLYEDIKIHKNDLKLTVNKLESVKQSLTKMHGFIARDSALKANWRMLAEDTAGLFEKIKSDTSKLTAITESYNNLVKEQIVDVPNNSPTKTTDFGALPQITSILGKREVIPQLQLYGSYNYENRSTSIEANLGLSFAASNNPDTNNLHAIFIPTASNFLIYSNFIYSFWTTNQSSSNDKDSAKRLALRLDFGFAGKNLVFDTTKTIGSINNTMLYTKAGLELGILPKRFSIYANVNTATILDKVNEFRNATGLDSKFFGYLDCGAKFFLDPTPQAKVDLGLYIYSNINFIVNGGDVKRVTHSEDLVIPSIQIGVVKRLGRL